MVGLYLVNVKELGYSFRQIRYRQDRVRVWNLRGDFASKVLTAITYFFLNEKQNPLLSKLQVAANLGCAASKLFLEINLHQQLWDANEKIPPEDEERALSYCRIIKEALILSRIALKEITKKETLQLPKLILSTAITALAYYSHFYEAWYVAPHKVNQK